MDSPKPITPIPKDEYQDALHTLQIELVKLQRHFIDNNDRILVLLEGRDAAGGHGPEGGHERSGGSLPDSGDLTRLGVGPRSTSPGLAVEPENQALRSLGACSFRGWFRPCAA